MEHKYTGKFISFEGPEGSGKTTQVNLTTNYLRERGYEVKQVREPGGTPAGEAMRNILQHNEDIKLCFEAEIHGFLFSRAQLVHDVIIPSLRRGEIVITDRFYDSTIAYQGYGRGENIELLRAMCLHATQGLKPDLTILLDIDPEKGLLRLHRRCGEERDKFEREELPFHERVRQGYLEIARKEKMRFHVVPDINLNEQGVQVEIRKVLDDLLGLK